MTTTTVYLILAPGPVVRAIRKNRPMLERDEAAVKLTLDVPIPEAAAIRPVGIEVEMPDAGDDSEPDGEAL